MKPIVSCFRHFKPMFYIFDNFWKFSEFKFSLLYKKTIIKFTWFILHIKIRGLNEIFSYKTDFTANLHFSRGFFWGIKHKNLFFSPKGPPFDFSEFQNGILPKRGSLQKKRTAVLNSVKYCQSFAPWAIIFEIIAQGANDTLFYAEFRTVFLFSVNFPILGGFRFEILKNQRGGLFGEKNMKKIDFYVWYLKRTALKNVDWQWNRF